MSSTGVVTRDSGGPGIAGRPYAIGTSAQPELFVPDTAGTFYPRDQWMSGRVTVTNNISVAAPRGTVSEATLSQVAARAGSASAKAVRMYR